MVINCIELLARRRVVDAAVSSTVVGFSGANSVRVHAGGLG